MCYHTITRYEGEVSKILFLVLFILVASVFSIFYLYKSKSMITIDEHGITEQGIFSNTTIAYGEIEKITFDTFLIHIESPGSNISLGKLMTKFEKSCGFITSHIRNCEDIQIKGKKKALNSHFETNALFGV